MRTMRWLLVFLVLLTACSPPAGNLDVTVLYPGQDSEMEMGESTRLTVQVTDARGGAGRDAPKSPFQRPCTAPPTAASLTGASP